MKIRLVNFNTRKLDFTMKEPPEDDNFKNSFDLNTSNSFVDDNDKSENTFFINFNITIDDKEFKLVIDSIHQFDTEEPITEEFKKSDFPKVNAPAIAFPYLRAFISTITLQSGLKPVMLPSINFVEVAKKNQDNQ